MSKTLFPAILAILLSIPFGATAGVYEITYTGQDLMDQARFPIPERQPVLMGTSIYFDHANYLDPRARWEKLLELPIFPAGTFAAGDEVTIKVIVNHTWIPNDTANSPSEPNDWDPHLMVGDGTTMVGVTTLEQGGVDLAYTVEEADVIYDDTSPQRVDYIGLDTGGHMFPYPELNVPYEVDLTWYLNGSTSVVATVAGLTGYRGSPEMLDQSQALNFVYMSDNQLHEEYLINTVTVRIETDDLSCNCDTPGLFDPPMDQDITVKKGNRVIPLKFILCDVDGNAVTDLDISAPMVEVDYVGGAGDIVFEEEDFLSAGQGDDGNLFAFTGDHWQFNLQTKMFSASGVYTITAVSTDPDFDIFPTCSVNFIIE